MQKATITTDAARDAGQPIGTALHGGFEEAENDEFFATLPTITLPPKTHSPVTRATHCPPPLVDRVEIIDALDTTRRLTTERITLARAGLFTTRAVWSVPSNAFDIIRAAAGCRLN